MIGLIVARSKNNVIGKGGEIPWRIKGEQKQFKELTTGNVVVMGRRSYEEIGHPLPNRETIVVSRTKQFEGQGVRTAGSVREAIELAHDKDVFIAGGYGLYREAIPFVDVMYITEVDLVIEDGDVFFPEFNEEDFEKTIGETLGDEIRYTRTEYLRKKQAFSDSSGCAVKVALCEDNEWLLSEDAFAIYSQCMYHATYEDYKTQMNALLVDPSVKVFVCESQGTKTGMMVLDYADEIVEIVGIAVSGDTRRKGIGRKMIRSVVETENLQSIKAQTDEDSIGFYRKCGFSEEKTVIEYPDGAAVRYNCILKTGRL